MRTLLLILLIIFLPGTLISQHYHFVYIQGENQQDFYIKKTGELLSSSATGFIILPKLQSGTHQFTVGFPKNQWPEYEFQVEVKSADRGFTLKNFEDKGWGLFDLQTLDIIYGKKIDPPKAVVVPESPKSDDPFAVILASAVGVGVTSKYGHRHYDHYYSGWVIPESFWSKNSERHGIQVTRYPVHRGI